MILGTVAIGLQKEVVGDTHWALYGVSIPAGNFKDIDLRRHAVLTPRVVLTV